MSNNGPKRKRTGRSAGLELPPGRLSRTLSQLRKTQVLTRVGLCLVTVLAIWAIHRGWNPPFGFQLGYVPQRAVTSKVAFQVPNPEATREAKNRALRQVLYVYQHDPSDIAQLRAALRNTVVEVTSAPNLESLKPEVWRQFEPLPVEGQAAPTPEKSAEDFEKFRAAVAGADKLARFDAAVADALAPFERDGLLEKLAPQHVDENQQEIAVYRADHPGQLRRVQVAEVLIGNASTLKERLLRRLESPLVAERVFHWLLPRLKATLDPDEPWTQRARQAAQDAVPEQFAFFEVGQTLAKGREPLEADTLKLLETEYQTALNQLTLGDRALRSLAVVGMLAALSVLCGYYLFLREPRLFGDIRRFSVLLVMVVASLAVAKWMSDDSLRGEIVPLLLFGMTLGIAHGREVALLLSVAVAIVFALLMGYGLGAFLVLIGTMASAVLLLGHIRTRSKLIKVGFLGGLISMVLTVLVGLLNQQPLGEYLATEALRNAVWTFVAGFVITGSLPFVESLFGVLTELSLLELGDVAHPLLQELVRRAPGTYNHSINVGSIGQAAAEAVGANGLLVRVGAYFHDIGKMLKPGYFAENQAPGSNRHDALVPAMSTLIIIAHIKDGADLARQHHLPAPIIDFILQHHGTTLVEYFYRRANEQRESDPHACEVTESAFRYPGPKPQTVEAAVLMLADAVESASRVLVEPTPARIESLVSELAMKRLLDGQFDECGLTLKQLRLIEDSLVKSLTAVYHGRVKYPNQRTA